MTELTISKLLQQWCDVETWRPAVENSNYSISSWGRVKGPKGFILSAPVTHGYEAVNLSFSHYESITTRVHRMVLSAFIGPPPFAGAIAAHNDGNRRNNRVDNLRWASAIENQADRLRHKTEYRGVMVRQAKLKDADILTILRRARSGEMYKHIARDYGVSISTVSLIKKGRIWKHVLEGASNEQLTS